MKLDDSKNAKAMFAKALDLDKDFVPAQNNLATIFIKEGKFDLAKGLLDRAIKRRADMSRLFVNRGICQAWLKNYDAAKLDYLRAAELDAT
ncbi:MAG: tetratricopeptide repeat protein, partial [Thermodesulfobacteriota bacterium]